MADILHDQSRERGEWITDGAKLIRELAGLFFIFLGLFIGLSLCTYDPGDPSFDRVVSGGLHIANSAGMIGADLSSFLVSWLGTASFIPVIMFLCSGFSLITRGKVATWVSTAGWAVLAVCLLAFIQSFSLTVGKISGGGILGSLLLEKVHFYFSGAGSTLFWLFLTLVGFELAVGIPWIGLFGACAVIAADLGKNAFTAETLHYAWACVRAGHRITRPEPEAPEISQEFVPKIPKEEAVTTPESSDDGAALPLLLTEKSLDQGSLQESESNEVFPLSITGIFPEQNPALTAGDGRSFPIFWPNAAKSDGAADDGRNGPKADGPEQDHAGDDENAGSSQAEDPPQDELSAAEEQDAELAGQQHDGGTVCPPADSPREVPRLPDVHDAGRAGGLSAAADGSPTDPLGNEGFPGVAEDVPPASADKSAVPSAAPKSEDKADGFYSPDEEPQESFAPVPLPDTDLLDPVSGTQKGPSEWDLQVKGRALIRCLGDFNVQAAIAGIVPGPVVTMYELRPERGVRASRFSSLSDDIAMALKATAVRIQSPIPGTDTIGIEVPNDVRQNINFREVIESESFQKSRSPLSIGLGQDMFGRPVTIRLDEMPHLLVAGATGAGKSVCLNSIILSFLYKAQPDDVRLLLIDPKRVEMAMFADLPHLLHPVVTDMDLAKNALLWAQQETEDRYKLFENNKVRNISSYNEMVGKINANLAPGQKPLKKLPYIVIIVDELSDLMMAKGKEVENPIIRMGQIARAGGVHLILATQRPSSNVVTGLIKANFPSRIAFQVASNVDSRVILDSPGAEKLLGKGDMLFKARTGVVKRMHGSFVSDAEVAAVVDYWKKSRSPSYSFDLSEYGDNGQEESVRSESDDNRRDPMYDTVLSWMQDKDEISISMLQRNFHLGFGRAGRLIDQMEKDGLVGPSIGSKPRKIVH
ncbi:MAG: DNA translocase FtsK [Mailhella sp.]|nr:DNA translocase FtsK [Mailhella sp.]